MSFTEGRVVLILEGGSNLDFISKSMHAYLEVLLADKPIIESVPGTSFNSYQVDQQQRETLPFENTVEEVEDDGSKGGGQRQWCELLWSTS
ncbi:hypothetical protein JHK85_000465 [Glycine max]|nr:hypothetical protein JHK85_000465 [Glycine max]